PRRTSLLRGSDRARGGAQTADARATRARDSLSDPWRIVLRRSVSARLDETGAISKTFLLSVPATLGTRPLQFRAARDAARAHIHRAKILVTDPPATIGGDRGVQ